MRSPRFPASFPGEIVVRPWYWTLQPPMYFTEESFRSSFVARNAKRAEQLRAKGIGKSAGPAEGPSLDAVVLEYPRLQLIIPTARRDHKRRLEISPWQRGEGGVMIHVVADFTFTLLRLLYHVHQAATPLVKDQSRFVLGGIVLHEIATDGDPVYLLHLDS